MPSRKITITGQKQIAPKGAGQDGLQLQATYIVKAAMRDSAESHTIDIGGDKIVEFEFDDGTCWMADAKTLHELFPESDQAVRSGDAFQLPVTLRSSLAERGLFGDIALSLVRVFTKKAISGTIGDIAAKLEDKALKGQEGLFRLDSEFGLQKFDKKPSLKPFLLFIHGTNSSTEGAYGHLKGSDVWNFIKSTYSQNVLAFQHRTLTSSPLENAVDLVSQLPDNIELHIISHSRGGLIGDILCRYGKNSNGTQPGFSKANIDLLKKETDRDSDIASIKKLNNLFIKKQIVVKKFVRVACPAAGTKLASQRLADIFNIFFNLLGGNANPAADILKSLIAETIKTKDDLKFLPGIEAMNPESPFLKILNDRNPDAGTDDPSLAVISGNSKAGIRFKGLKVIALRLFFQQRNDLVVNTDSMYLGTTRTGNIQYFFDEGPEVEHTSYFSNSKTQEALLQALKTKDGEPIPGFTTVGQQEVPGKDRGEARGLEHGELTSGPPSGKKPIVVLLPGIMGSNLQRNGKRIWINYLKFITGGLMELDDVSDNSIEAASIVRTSYKKLVDRLSFTYDVVIFPFDWRKQLNKCAEEFNDKIIELLKLQQPIKIIGHSMGGVLVRDFIIKHEQTWNELNASKEFRLLFLGAPLGGSMRIPAVLFGSDPIINTLSTVDQRHTKRELLTMFSAFPGILSLLPLTIDKSNDFAEERTWKNMQDAFGDSNWPLPGKEVLNEFKAYRNGILEKKGSIDYSNMVYIAGKDKATPCDYSADLIPPRTELIFLYTGEGDQSVTWESGIPEQLIEKKAVYYVNVTHGALANEPAIFDGIEDILIKGFTNQLSTMRPELRGEEKQFRIGEVFNFDLSERGIQNTVLGLPDKAVQRPNQVSVGITVATGDLGYASFPVLAGHFKNDGILYAEDAIDKKMKQCLSARYSLGIYPGDIGTSDVHINNGAADDFHGAIIVGLGEPGTLTPSQLTKTVEQGTANYLLTIQDIKAFQKEIGISSLIIACGYGGLSIEDSVKSIIEGVNNANQKVIGMCKDATRTVRHIEFIELYEDKALDCMYSLSKIENFDNKQYNIKIINKKIDVFFGSRKLLPSNSSEEWWNRITIKVREDKMPGSKKDQKIKALLFGSSTGDAREEEKELFSSTPLIDLFIDEVSVQGNWTDCSARAIFELMIPNAFKDRLKRKGNVNWVLDKEAAMYPWELLQDDTINGKPLCVNAGMIRQLLTPDFSANIKRSSNEKVFIVGDPLLDGFINQLPGAKKEAQTVDKLFGERGYAKRTLINRTADEIVRNLFCDNYKIIHLAGHGVFNPESPRQSGMVIGNDIFITTFDIGQLSSIPELVFVNCCHLGKVSSVEEKYYRNRYKLAANIGTQLIEMGVKAVVVAGWAVADDAANLFAKRFYEEMFLGSTFGKAIREARKLIYEKYQSENNTWGAYQCYGDPFYKLMNRTAGWKKPTVAFITSHQAETELENLRSRLDCQGEDTIENLNALRSISKQVDDAEIRTAYITELEACICAELCDYPAAIEKFAHLFTMEEAQFSVAALEKYCSVRLRDLLSFYFSSSRGNKKIPGNKIVVVIKDLIQLLKISPTAERYILLGSAYKRQAFLDPAKKKSALKRAAYYYYMATTKADKHSTDVYSTTNWLEMEMLIQLNDKKTNWINSVSIESRLVDYKPRGWTGTYNLLSKKEAKEKLDDLLKKCPSTVPRDFWELTNKPNIYLCALFLDDKERPDIINELEDQFAHLWRKAGSPDKQRAMFENILILHELVPAKDKLKESLKDLKERLEKLIGAKNK